MKKKLLSFVFIMILSLGICVQSYAKEEVISKNENTVIKFTKENVNSGVGYTVIQEINEGEIVAQEVIMESTVDFLNRINNTQSRTARNYNDGIQEYLEVHLSARNWVGKSFALEFYGHSDEILQYVKGTWYAKSTNLLEGDYYRNTLSIPYYNSNNTVTTTIANVSVGNATEVELGHKNVTFKNIFGYEGSLPPISSPVSKP